MLSIKNNIFIISDRNFEITLTFFITKFQSPKKLFLYFKSQLFWKPNELFRLWHYFQCPKI